MLDNCVASVLCFTPNIIEIIIINNGHPDSISEFIKRPGITIINNKENMGWMGSINQGIAISNGEFIMFLNDDTQILDANFTWLNNLLQVFKYDKIGAVGPISNVVMGTQNMFSVGKFPRIYLTTLLIGFCVMVRKSVIDEIGLLDEELHGGDDFDYSIRIRKAGYHLAVNREVFVYHHGFQTGIRVHGDKWLHEDSQDRTNIEIIRKHGLKAWQELLSFQTYTLNDTGIPDIEGDIVRSLVPKYGDIYEVGCGTQKTLPNVIGVDQIPQGKQLNNVDKHWNSAIDISVADIQADVFEDEFAVIRSASCIIARHILEHTHDPAKALQHWWKMIKKNGKLIIAVPDEALNSSIPLNPTHKSSFTPESITNLVNLCLVDSHIEYCKDTNNGISLVCSVVKRR